MGSQAYSFFGVKMPEREIELAESGNKDKKVTETVVETKQQEVRPASISTLFLGYSTKGDRVFLFFGFACT